MTSVRHTSNGDTTSDAAPEISAAPEEGRITDEAIARARARIGSLLRPEGPYLQDATQDTLKVFVNGIGDLNPLFRDAEHGRSTRFGSMIAHPTFPYVFGWPGRSRWGFPGVHGFYAGNDWEWFRVVRPGQRLSCIERVIGVEEKESSFSGRLILQYAEANYVNERDELVARVLGITTRHERKASREAGKYKDIKPYEYTADELEEIDVAIFAERDNIRGDDVRYWDDVQVGDQLTPIARGPLTAMDTIGFLVGSARGHTHGIVMESARKHAAHYFRNSEVGGGVEYTGVGHHRESTARQVGVPGVYDYGPQRTSWMASAVTNWMGDAGFLKRLRVETRRFNTVGDTTWCKGKVTRRYLKDGYPLVDLEIWGENQRGEMTTPGLATVMLPSRNVAEAKLVLDGSQLDLDLASVR